MSPPDVLEQVEGDGLADRAPVAPVPVARLAQLAHELGHDARSPRAPRARPPATGVSPGRRGPSGSASTREPSAARRVGTITTTSLAPHHHAAGRELPRPRGLLAARPGPARSRRHTAPAPRGSCTTSRPRPWEITPARSSTARKRLADSREEPASWARSAWVAVTSTSPSGSPAATSSCDELAEDHRHAALDGLEGLAREALVGLAQAPAERDHQAHRDLRVLAHQPAHVAARAPPPRSSARSPRRSPSGARPRTSPARRRCRRGRTSPA